MPASFHLVVMPAGGMVSCVPIVGPVVRIGSSADAEVHLPDPELAPVHARIEDAPNGSGGHVVIRDHNPFLVNGLRSKAHLLAPNDLIVVGKNAISYRAGEPPPERALVVVGSEPRGCGSATALRRLYHFAERVRLREGASDLADQLLADVLAVTGASRGTLVRFTADDDPVRIATATRGSFSGAEVLFSRTLLGRMRDEGRAVVVASTALDPMTAGAKSFVGSAQSAIAAPIVVDGRVLGALYVSARAGALGAPELEALELYASLSAQLLETERKTEELESVLVGLGEDTTDADADTLLMGASPSMRELRRSIRKVAASKAPILVVGETGSGKELVAREIHRLSPRAGRPFVAVNCGAIPSELVAGELFGHVKGAFTQAHKDRLGFFRSAEGGTIFLDEIGEMPLMQQVALLRVLQESAVTPVGAETSEPVDARVVCATNRLLEVEVAAGRFRQDLLFRIAVVTLPVPPLRDRAEDVVRLANHFLRREAREQGVLDLRFSDAAIAGIRRARWEGNVRELEAAVRRAALMRDTEEISPRDLGLDTHSGGDSSDSSDPNDAETITAAVRPLAMARDEFLRGYVKEIVDRFGGNRTAAADALLVTPRTIFKYLEE